MNFLLKNEIKSKENIVVLNIFWKNSVNFEIKLINEILKIKINEFIKKNFS
jgi:hypothetical protein